jgi:hypothetical protein
VREFHLGRQTSLICALGFVFEHLLVRADQEATIAGWTESRGEVGIFRVLAEAAVRPRGRARRGKARGPLFTPVWTNLDSSL